VAGEGYCEGDGVQKSIFQHHSQSRHTGGAQKKPSLQAELESTRADYTDVKECVPVLEKL